MERPAIQSLGRAARRLALAGIVTLLLAGPLGAQGALSVQGLGYPPGQLSTMSAATGGALAEFDPQSPLNPAVIAALGATMLHVHYLPEFRRVRSDGRTDRTSTARFPVLGAIVGVGDRLSVGLSASTLLDRTWATRFRRIQEIDTRPDTSLELFRSEGAVSDLRLAGAWRPARALRIGVGVHALTGENRLFAALERTTGVVDTLFDNTIGYSGAALSAGAELVVSRLTFAASARRGGTLRTRNGGDSLLATARVPDRLGFGLRFDGIPGATLAGRAEWVGWSAMQGLGTPDGLSASDAWDIGIGGDIAGPRFGERVTTLRVGGRQRRLPFGLNRERVKETTFSGGIGIPFAGNRAVFDLSLLRASRTLANYRPVDGGTATSGRPDESAWVLGIGLTVRP